MSTGPPGGGGPGGGGTTSAPHTAPSGIPWVSSRRAVYALSLLFTVLVVGTVGFRLVAGLDWVDAFYFESMLATGQGPPLPLTTDASKIYASVMAFVSVGSVITTVVFALGPVVARVWHEAAQRVEHEARRLERDLVPPREKR
jgi:hypothetical protein